MSEEKKQSFFRYSFDKADLLFLAILIVALYVSFNYVDQFKQIPSPLYGGDYYNGLGGVIHIVDGGSPLESAQMKGELPWVPWFYHLSVALFSKFTGLEPMFALLNFSHIALVLSGIILYLLIQKLTNNKYVFLVVLPLIFSHGNFPLFKYSAFAAMISIPLFLLSLFIFLKCPSIKRAVLSGILLGIVGLSNTQTFFVGFLSFGFVALAFLLPKLINFKSWKLEWNKDSKEQLKLYLIIFLIGFAISLSFWFKPIFIYQGSTPNDIQNITTPDITSSSTLWKIISSQLYSVFIPYTSGPLLLFTILTLLGLYKLLLTRSNPESKFALVLLIVWIFLIIHPLITLPLLKMQFVISMMSEKIQPTIAPLLMCFGLSVLYERMKERKFLLAAVFVILFLTTFTSFWGTWSTKGGTFEEMAKEPLLTPWVELSTWVRSNTNVNDVFLTTNEDGFMLNALSGRKIVSYRRAHASPYINMHERMADQAVMVYGTNDAKRVELMEKYDVKYLLLTNRWVLNEFQFDQNNGQLVGFFDPLSIPNTPENKKYWTENGVQFIEVNMPMDPAPPSDAPTYDLLIAIPYEMSFEPLNPEIYNHFTLKKTIVYEGQEWFKIYEINN